MQLPACLNLQCEKNSHCFLYPIHPQQICCLYAVLFMIFLYATGRQFDLESTTQCHCTSLQRALCLHSVRKKLILPSFYSSFLIDNNLLNKKAIKVRSPLSLCNLLVGLREFSIVLNPSSWSSLPFGLLSGLSLLQFWPAGFRRPFL